MKITEVRVEHFGALQDVELTALSPGLNVVFAPDPAAKTALVCFLRRMLFGLTDAHPASREGGGRIGAMTIEHAGASWRLVRIDRAGHPDAFAICGRACETAGTETLRLALAAANRCLVERVCLVAADQAYCRDELPALVECLSLRKGATATAAPSVESPADRPPATRWEQRCEQLRLEIAALARSESRRQHEYCARIRPLDDELCSVETDVSWLDAELQAALTDLRETEDRLWTTPAESPTADRPPAHGPAGTIDGYVEHLRQVIGDLAERRLNLSLMLADRAGGLQDVPPHSIRVENERMRIDRCESELLHQLRCLEHSCAAGAGQTVPGGRPRPVPHPVWDPPAQRERLQKLLARCGGLRQRLESARHRHCELHAERRRLDDERRRIAANRMLDARWYELSVAQQQLAAKDLDRQAAQLLDAVRRTRRVPEVTAESVWQRASTILRRLVGGESARLVDVAESADLLAHNDRGVIHPELLLRGGTSEQAALALRLALLSSMARAGIELPAVWDEVLGDSDMECVRRAGTRLAESAQGRQQIILLTSRADVAAVLAECGATKHQLAQQPAPAAEPEEASRPLESRHSPDQDPPAEPLVRIHPAAPHWLTADSSLNELPSLGPQMARQLRRMGLVDVGDLIALDLSRCQFLLSESRLTAEQVRLWQAEAVLLCCVPDMTGRDAQLLVSCGLLAPAELAAANADELTLRIDRLRGGESTRWRPYSGVWPRAETVRSWIHAARRARPLEALLAGVDGSRRRPRRLAAQSDPGGAPSAEMPSGSDRACDHPAPPGFRLRPESPVVDAPSIGHKTARLLQRIGIMTIGDLLVCDAEVTARRIRHPRITADVLVTWQRQAALMCAIHELRCGDAQVLVACCIHQPADLLRISASALYAIVGPFVETIEGRRLLRSATPPTAEDVARWVESAQEGGLSRAA